MTCLLPLITDTDRKRLKLVVSYQSLSIAISRYLSKSNGCHILPKNAIEWFCRIIRSLQRTKISVLKNTKKIHLLGRSWGFIPPVPGLFFFPPRGLFFSFSVFSVFSSSNFDFGLRSCSPLIDSTRDLVSLC